MKAQDAYKVMFREYPDVVTVEQMCEMLGGISTKTGYRLLRNGTSKALWWDGATVFPSCTFLSIWRFWRMDHQKFNSHICPCYCTLI